MFSLSPDDIDILVFLQNAYYKSGKMPRRRAWLYGLRNSHTGKRLLEMLPAGYTIYPANASSRVGNNSASCYPPDPAHMQEIIETVRPRVILACGRIAQGGLSRLGIEFIEAPHPAWRQLTAEHCESVKRHLIQVLSNTK